jgi:hypothetical protein
MFERKNEKLAPFPVFIGRVAASLGMAVCMIAVALSIGLCGYHWIAGFGWVDAYLEASMILGGMGPVNPLKTDGAKIFAATYALFSGLVFIAIMGIIISPIVHRMLHKFHLDESDVKKKK